MRQEFGMLEYHYELPNLSPRRYQLQVPVNYVSHWALLTTLVYLEAMNVIYASIVGVES